MSKFETVHTMTDYYDGPRRGIADYHGVPHVYESAYADVSDDSHDGNNVFRLSPITADVFKLALEAWQIWRRWETASVAGEAKPGYTYPSLPSDRARREELEQLLSGRLNVAEDSEILARAVFRIKESSGDTGSGFRPLEVSWTPILA